jgi:hypothetical protein
MSTPEPQAQGPYPGGCTVFSVDSAGRPQVTHLPQPPHVWVVLGDGTRLSLEEYLADEETYLARQAEIDRQAAAALPPPSPGDGPPA